LRNGREQVRLPAQLAALRLRGDRYLKTGEVLPDSAVNELRKFKAIFLGAVGHPQVQPGILEKGILLRLRFELEQYINLRPVKLFRAQDCPLKDKGPEHVDFVVVRENNEGLYAGSGGYLFKGTPHEVAIQESVNTRRVSIAASSMPSRSRGTPAAASRGRDSSRRTRAPASPRNSRCAARPTC